MLWLRRRCVLVTFVYRYSFAAVQNEQRFLFCSNILKYCMHSSYNIGTIKLRSSLVTLLTLWSVLSILVYEFLLLLKVITDVLVPFKASLWYRCRHLLFWTSLQLSNMTSFSAFFLWYAANWFCFWLNIEVSLSVRESSFPPLYLSGQTAKSAVPQLH